MHATYPTQHILLHFVILVIHAEEYKLQNPSYAIFSILHTNYIFQLQDTEQHMALLMFVNVT